MFSYEAPIHIGLDQGSLNFINQEKRSLRRCILYRFLIRFVFISISFGSFVANEIQKQMHFFLILDCIKKAKLKKKYSYM